jgi:hypothetical protein
MKAKQITDMQIRKSGGNGFGSRYDKWTANYADTQPKYTYGVNLLRICTKCKSGKILEGGTNKNRKFVCKACNEADK